MLGLLLAAGVVVIVSTWGPPAPTATPAGALSFAAFGDAPYYPWEAIQFRLVLRDVDAHDLDFSLSVGDIFWRPCTDAMYRKHLAMFEKLRRPVILSPGDNEWTDCHEAVSGSYAPLERLDRLRQIFFSEASTDQAAATLRLTSQADSVPYTEFVENARWSLQGVVFATVHMVGSRNALEPFPARTEADDLAARRRTEAAAAWIRETFEEAGRAGAAAVVVVFHANPGFEESPDDAYRSAFEPFITTLEEETEAFAGPVLLVHGDDHDFVVDHPLVRRTTGRRLDNLTRLQVPGSPLVGWVRVVVTPRSVSPFAFEERVVPAWKYW